MLVCLEEVALTGNDEGTMGGGGQMYTELEGDIIIRR